MSEGQITVMKTVKDYMSTALISLEATETAARAAQIMAELGVGAVIVTAGGKPAGISTERDLVHRVLAEGRDPRTVSVGTVMTPRPTCVREEATLEEALALMTKGGFRHLPVLDAQKSLVGILSIKDLARQQPAHRFMFDPAFFAQA